MKQAYLLFLTALISILSFAQNREDTTDGKFHDDLLNHLAGKWDVTSVAHDASFTLDLRAEWVMNHQYMHIHFKSHEVVPWLNVPFEAEIFFGYNHDYKRYTVHGMSVHGDDGPFEGFCYAYRTENEIKTVSNFGSDTLIVQRFIWEPASTSWRIESRSVIGGKEGEVFLAMKLVAAKQSNK